MDLLKAEFIRWSRITVNLGIVQTIKWSEKELRNEKDERIY